ncbi:MAG: glutamate-1-semialdehyde 2,1-aminomutase [Sedimentisphaerales bacterium]|nr:glutamate-1-semialdehyde 2,1-aminomutase [Sedimentisphaerales bacterium]
MKSKEAFLQACTYIPGGVNSPVRAFGGVDVDPLFIERGEGSKIYDIDGNEYIDFVCSWGPLILGHTHPKVVAAVKAAAERGMSFGAPTLAETQLAEKVISAFDSIEKVRMINSGTEAVMTAIRLARAYTGRDYIIKMVGCYHGHSDALLVSAGSGLAEQSIPSSAGVPTAFAEKTIALPYNDSAAVEAAFDKHKDRIAAVLVEPIAANMGLVVPKSGYLKSLRQLCDNNGAVLVFDEVISGFRVALGGAQEFFGIQADITCLGKIIGGGLPVGAVGGRAEIMDLLAPLGPVYQAGTLSGNPLAMAAAIATLDVLAERICYRRLEQAGRTLQEGFEEASRKTGIPVTVNRAGSILSCFFTEGPIENFQDVQHSNIGRFKKFFSGMLNQGIYLAPSAFETMFVSLAHSEKDLEKTTESVYNVFRELAG